MHLSIYQSAAFLRHRDVLIKKYVLEILRKNFQTKHTAHMTYDTNFTIQKQ